MITAEAQVLEAQGGELVHELPQADEVLLGQVTILAIYYLGKIRVFVKSPSIISNIQVLCQHSKYCFNTNPSMFNKNQSIVSPR